MPAVLELPEIVEEAQEEAFRKSETDVFALHPGFASKIAAFISMVAPRRRQCAHQEIAISNVQEFSIDILARQHPYIYIKAIAC